MLRRSAFAGAFAGAFAVPVGALAIQPPAEAAFLASVNVNGWSGEAANPGALPAYSLGDGEFDPDNAPIYSPRLRIGYDNACNAVAGISEPLIPMRRVRRPYTTAGAATHLLASPATVSLHDWTFSTDTLPGGVNNSTLVSPLPIALHALRDRRVCGNTLRVEVVGFHIAGRARKPVAGFTGYVTDGTTPSPTVLFTGPVVLPGGGADKRPIIGYYADIDTSGYADGTAITFYPSCFPRIGGPASVLTASGTPGARGFTPLVFYKHAARASNPVYVYVDKTAGVDGTVTTAGQIAGVTKVSTNAATAKANPFLTIVSAVTALKAATLVTGGFTDGCRVRLGAGTWSDGTNTGAGTYQSAGEITIESDPAIGPADAIIQLTGTNWRQLYITYQRVAFTRLSAVFLTATTGGRIALVNCSLDAGGVNSAIMNSAPLWTDGLTITNLAATTLVSGTWSINLARGIECGTPLVGAPGIDGFAVMGCNLGNVGLVTGGRSLSGGICGFNVFMGSISTGLVGLSGPADIDGFALVQNVFEFSSATSNPTLRASADNVAGALRNFVHWANTYAGSSIFGRENSGYDEKLAAFRFNNLWSEVGNIKVCPYTKHDWFIGSAGGASAAEAEQHVGSWGILYSCGARGNLHQYPTIAGAGPSGSVNGSESRAHLGLSAKTSTATYTRLDPLFVGGNNGATRYDGTTAIAGVSGPAENYVIGAGSPAIGMVPDHPLPFDLAGVARSAISDAGAFVA